jgi:hypothetical protein
MFEVGHQSMLTGPRTEGSHGYTEKTVVDSQQVVVLQLWGWVGAKNPSPQKNQHKQNFTQGLIVGSCEQCNEQ